MRRRNYFAIAAGLVISTPAYAQTNDPFPAAQTKIPVTLAAATPQPESKTTIEFPPGTSDSGSKGTTTEAEPVLAPKKTPAPTPTKK